MSTRTSCRGGSSDPGSAGDLGIVSADEDSTACSGTGSPLRLMLLESLRTMFLQVSLPRLRNEIGSLLFVDFAWQFLVLSASEC